MSSLPRGWESATVGDLVVINPKLTDKPGDLTEVSFLPMKNVEEESGKANIVETRSFGDVRKGYTYFGEGDIVFAKITPCMENGKIAVVGQLVNGLGFGSTEFYVFRPLPDIYNRYLLYFLLRKKFRIEASYQMTGAVGQKRVPRKWLASYPVPIAPTSEQKKIVEKVESLLGTLSLGIAESNAVLKKSEQYRRAILRDAFTGKLSEDWRRDNGDGGESAETLLRRILDTREKTWIDERLKRIEPDEAPSDEFKFVDSVSSEFSKVKAKYKAPNSPQSSGLAFLPKRWELVTPEQLGFVQLGRQRSPRFTSKNYPTKYLRAANITNSGLDLSDLLEMEFTPDERKIYALQYGDLLFSEASGSPDHVGKPAMWRDEVSLCCFQNTVIRLRPVVADPEFLLICFRYLYEDGHLAKLAGGIGINHLTAKKFASLPIPLPPLSEQRYIVGVVARALEAAAATKNGATLSINAAIASREDILEKAFSGNLVSQDRNDESADVLLKRVREFRKKIDKPQIASKIMKDTKVKDSKTLKGRTAGIASNAEFPARPESEFSFDNFLKSPTLTLKKFSISGRYNSLHNTTLNFNGGSPLCLAGLNGSGKSNLIEALGEAFCQTELEHVPFDSKKGVKSSHFDYCVEYSLSQGKTELLVSLVKSGAGQTKILLKDKETIYDIVSAEKVFQSLLPPRIIAYTSGLNETLSFPFLRNRSYYSEEVRTLADRKSKDAVAHRLNSLYMDRGLNSCILLANFIFKSRRNLAIFKEYLRIVDVTSCELIIRKKLPGGEAVRLTRELENTIESLKALATNSTEDAKEHVFQYALNAQTKRKFKEIFGGGEKEFFLRLYKLSLLNPLALGKPDRDFYKGAEFKDRLLVRPPDVSDANAIFFVRNMTLKIEKPSTQIPYASISDGEHQFIQVFGTALLFDEPGNLFLFDEPESHFNPFWRARFVAILNQIKSTARQQFVLSTHSPYLISGCYSKNVFKFKRDGKSVVASCVAQDFETFGASFEFILKQLFELKVSISEEALGKMKTALKSDNAEDVREILGGLGESYERKFVIEHLMQLDTRKQK